MSGQSERWPTADVPPETVLEGFADALKSPLASLEESLKLLNDDSFRDKQVRKDLEILAYQHVERMTSILSLVKMYLEARKASGN